MRIVIIKAKRLVEVRNGNWQLMKPIKDNSDMNCYTRLLGVKLLS
jgi:hypothetical protein